MLFFAKFGETSIYAAVTVGLYNFDVLTPSNNIGKFCTNWCFAESIFFSKKICCVKVCRNVVELLQKTYFHGILYTRFGESIKTVPKFYPRLHFCILSRFAKGLFHENQTRNRSQLASTLHWLAD